MFINFYLFGDHTRDVEIRPLSESQYDTFSSSVSLEASMCLFPTQYERVSLKHDGTNGTVKMANLPVPSVCDRRDRQTTAKAWRDRRDSENVQSACPVIVWQRGQELNEKRETKLKSVLLWKYTYFRTIITKMWLVCESKLDLPNDFFVLIYCFLPINIIFS